jgi:hypothetical protein
MSSSIQQARRDTGSLSSNPVSKPGSQITMNMHNLMPPQANIFHQQHRSGPQGSKNQAKEVSLGISGGPKKLISDLKEKFKSRQAGGSSLTKQTSLLKQTSLFNPSKTSISKIFSNPHPKVESIIPKISFEQQDQDMDQCEYQLSGARHSDRPDLPSKNIKSFHSGASMKQTNSQDILTGQPKLRNTGFKKKSKSVTVGILKNKDPAARSVSIKSKKSVKFSSKKTIFKYKQPE